jgi:hypothetical protein
VNPLRPWLARIPARALIDTDPVFTQLRHLRDAEALAEAERHTAFFSFGENLGRPGCSAPEDGLDWRPSRQPVVLDAWTVTPGPSRGAFTTVMQWESYPAIHHAGRRYGVKAASFEPYVDLPRRTGEVLELALGSAGAPRDRLREHGWRLQHPFPPTRDPWAFQSYVRSSKGELSIAKQAYVESSSGWFSERSTGYLASGRPVLVQDTGFTEWLPSGEGIVAFSSPDEALAGLETINGTYRRHCGAARELAAEYFDARKVLPKLLERAMARSRPGAVRTGVQR